MTPEASSFEADAELKLYHTAYLAGWGPPDTAPAARQRLAEVTADPHQGVLASRLQLSVAAELLDADAFAAALARLEQANAVRLRERLACWQLLINLGRKAEAQRLAEADASRPASAWEAVQRVNLHRSLDLTDRVRQLLERYAPEFGDSESRWSVELWTVFAAFLTEAKDWPALEHLAVRMRARKRAGDLLAGYSCFLEGRAQHERNFLDLASTALSKAADLAFPTPNIGLQSAKTMLVMGHPRPARKVLAALEGALAREPDYWDAVGRTADALKEDAQDLLQAARRGCELVPDNLAFQLNYAAALMANRQAPEQALQLTLGVMNRRPDWMVARLYHGAALAMNRRFDEADTILNGVDADHLDGTDQAAFRLAQLETRLGQRHFGAAMRSLNQIQTNLLFAPQREWVEAARSRLAPLSNGGEER